MSREDLIFPREEDISDDYELRARMHLQAMAEQLTAEARAFQHSDLTVSKFILAVGAVTLTTDVSVSNPQYDVVAGNAISAARGNLAVSQELPDMGLWLNSTWQQQLVEILSRIKFKDDILSLPYEHEASVYIAALDALESNLAELLPANAA